MRASVVIVLAVAVVAALLLTPTAHGTHLGERAVLTAELQPVGGPPQGKHGCDTTTGLQWCDAAR